MEIFSWREFVFKGNQSIKSLKEINNEGMIVIVSVLSMFLSSWGWNRVFSLVCYIPQNKAIRSSSDESNFETGEIFIMGCSTRVLVWNILSQSRRCGQPQIDKMHIFIPITESSISPHISKVCLNESEKNKLEINPILHGLLIR